MSLRFHPAVQRDLNEVLDLIIFYQTSDGVKVTCVKHEKRHPLRGIQRR